MFSLKAASEEMRPRTFFFRASTQPNKQIFMRGKLWFLSHLNGIEEDWDFPNIFQCENDLEFLK